MIGLVARDALHEQVVRVDAESRAADMERPGRNTIWAVFGAGGNGTQSKFLGLVGNHQVTRTEKKTFSELLPSDLQEPIGADVALPEAMRRLRGGEVEAVPVVDENLQFIGVVTTSSLVNALFKRERELLKKSRDYRKSVQEDKRRRYDSVRRLEQLNQAFKKLMALLARPPGYELFQRGIEALAVVVEANYSSVMLMDDTGNFKETVFTGKPPGEPGETGNFKEQRWLLLERVIKENRILLVQDVPQYLRKANLPMTTPVFKSFLGVPISREGHVFGCVYCCDKTSGEAYTDDDEILAMSFAQALGLVMSQARETARRKRAERERDILSRIGLQLAGTDTLDKVGQVIRSVCEEFWNWDSFMLSVRRSGQTRFKVLLRVDKPPIVGEGENAKRSGEEVLVTSGDYQLMRRSTDELLLRGEPVLVKNREDQPTSDQGAAAARRHASLISVPVRTEGEVVGIISIQSFKPDDYQEYDRDLLQRIADRTGPALARVQAEKRSSVLLALAQKLSMTTTVRQAAETIVLAADELIGWDACSVYLYNPEKRIGHNLVHMDIVDGVRQVVAVEEVITAAGPIAEKVMFEGPQLILRDKPEFSHGLAKPFGDKSRACMSLLFVPLHIGSRAIGVLSIQSYVSQVYDNRDLALLQALGDFCSGALERTRVEQELRESEARHRKILEENGLEPPAN